MALRSLWAAMDVGDGIHTGSVVRRGAVAAIQWSRAVSGRWRAASAL